MHVSPYHCDLTRDVRVRGKDPAPIVAALEFAEDDTAGNRQAAMRAVRIQRGTAVTELANGKGVVRWVAAHGLQNMVLFMATFNPASVST